MAICYVLAIFSIIGQALYIKYSEEKKYVLACVCKTTAAILFISIGYLAYQNNPSEFNKLILIGFIFDGIGDFFLALRNLFLHTAMFATGTMSFMVGHVFFIYALGFIVNNIKLIIAIGIVLGVIMYLLYCKVCKFPTIFKIIGPIYCMMIVIIATSATKNFVTILSLKNFLMMIGLLLFNGSDLILIIYNFSKREKWMHPLYSLMYFLGQCILGLSLFL